MNIKDVVDVYLSTINYLMKVPSNGIKLYIEKGEYILFKPRSFRAALNKHIPDDRLPGKYLDEYLNVYKVLGLISTDKDRTRFTKTQKIDNKVMKVIAVKKRAYQLLVEMKKGDADPSA